MSTTQQNVYYITKLGQLLCSLKLCRGRIHTLGHFIHSAFSVNKTPKTDYNDIDVHGYYLKPL